MSKYTLKFIDGNVKIVIGWSKLFEEKNNSEAHFEMHTSTIWVVL